MTPKIRRKLRLLFIKWWFQRRILPLVNAPRDYIWLRRWFAKEKAWRDHKIVDGFSRWGALLAIYHMNILGRIPMILKPQVGWGSKPVSLYKRRYK